MRTVFAIIAAALLMVNPAWAQQSALPTEDAVTASQLLRPTSSPLVVAGAETTVPLGLGSILDLRGRLIPEYLLRQADCSVGRARGERDASMMHSSSGWVVGGVGSGLLLGLIGTGIITGVAASGSPQPLMIPEDVPEECYRSGYSSKAKSKNTVGALVGGLGGTVVWVVVLVAS